MNGRFNYVRKYNGTGTARVRERMNRVTQNDVSNE
jgi:hypothetical protein